MMPRRLPILADRSVQEAQANRLQGAHEYEAKVSAEGRISCTSGCASCCHYPLAVSILEGISLYQWLVDHYLWTPRLKAKLVEVKEQTLGLSPEVWLLAMIPCPLLTAELLCSAYESRPFMCRTIFSKGDPFYCHPHRLAAQRSGILDRTDAVAALWSAERKTLKRHQLQQVTIPLAAALLLSERIVKGELELEETNAILIAEAQSEK